MIRICEERSRSFSCRAPVLRVRCDFLSRLLVSFCVLTQIVVPKLLFVFHCATKPHSLRCSCRANRQSTCFEADVRRREETDHDQRRQEERRARGAEVCRQRVVLQATPTHSGDHRAGRQQSRIRRRDAARRAPDCANCFFGDKSKYLPSHKRITGKICVSLLLSCRVCVATRCLLRKSLVSMRNSLCRATGKV